MFKRRTLFILGAGASAEVGFPVGAELASTIAKKMDIGFKNGLEPLGAGDFSLFGHVVNSRRNELKEFQQAAWLIRDGIALQRSIDDFLDIHRANERLLTLGKAAIVKSILEAEKKSKLYFKPNFYESRFDPLRVANTWFVRLAQVLGRGIQKDDVATKLFANVSFLIFNYDRCVEHFLKNAVERLYGVKPQDAEAIVKQLRIIHPYGTIPLEIPFGGEENCDYHYVKLAEGIKIYTEQVSEESTLIQIADEVASAQCIVFLGFAYHGQNMAMLRPAERLPPKPIFGTAFGMSAADVEVVKHQVSSFFKFTPALREKMVRLENGLKSADLFDSYSKSLSGGD